VGKSYLQLVLLYILAMSYAEDVVAPDQHLCQHLMKSSVRNTDHMTRHNDHV